MYTFLIISLLIFLLQLRIWTPILKYWLSLPSWEVSVLLLVVVIGFDVHLHPLIVETITLSSNILYDITSYRERKGQEYADGIDYNAIKKLKITKEHIFSLFRDPRTAEIPNANRPHISIEWCTFQPFLDNWMDKWYTIFDMPPHNNREIPLYFFWKMYAEFMLGKHVKYFDIFLFQGNGEGIPQNWPNSRIRDVDRPILAPCR